ncbi:MAG: response regulator [Kofleriaceae bacterium]
MAQVPERRILVVEDERVVARDLQSTLQQLGYDVPATAGSAEDAFRIAAEHPPDLVLMDIRIKGKRDGIETAAALREHFKVPVVFLTAHTDEHTMGRVRQTEHEGYLVKPVTDAQLRVAVENALYDYANKHDFEVEEITGVNQRRTHAVIVADRDRDAPVVRRWIATHGDNAVLLSSPLDLIIHLETHLWEISTVVLVGTGGSVNEDELARFLDETYPWISVEDGRDELAKLS